MALVGGGTWAYFSDPEAVADNVFTAGTLDVKLTDDNETDSDGVTATWGNTALRPDDADVGDDTGANLSEGVATLTISNDGSIDGYLDLSNFSVVDDENAAVVSEAEGDTADDGDLGPLVDVWMFWDGNNNGTFEAATDTDIWGTNGGEGVGFTAAVTPVKLDTLTGDVNSSIAIAAGTDTYITMYWRWPDAGDDSDNDAQGDEATLSFSVDLGSIAD